MKILVYTSGSLGDILVLFPILSGIRARYPHGEITLLNKHDTSFSNSPLELTREAGYVDRIVIISKWGKSCIKFFSHFPWLLRNRYDHVYWLCRESQNFTRKIAHDRPIFQRLAKGEIYGFHTMAEFPDSEGIVQHVATNMLLRINMGSSSPLTPGPHLFPRERLAPAIEKAGKYLDEIGASHAGGELFAVCVGGKKNTCHWPLEKYIQLLKQIISETPLVPVFIGGPQDVASIESVIQKLPPGKAFYAASYARDLVGTIALLTKMRFYLGNDTGSMHLAASAGIPCIGIFSSHNYRGKWQPLGEGHESIYPSVRLDCEVCGLSDCKYGQPAKCIDSIPPQEVFAAVLKKIH